MSHGVHMAAILAAILDFHENQFLGHSKIPHQREIVEHMLHWGNLHLEASNFVSFVSPAAILAAILDFNENLFWGYSKIPHLKGK